MRDDAGSVGNKVFIGDFILLGRICKNVKIVKTLQYYVTIGKPLFTKPTVCGGTGIAVFL